MTGLITKNGLAKNLTRVTIELFPNFPASWYGDVNDGMLWLYDPNDKKKYSPITVALEDVADCKILEMV